MIEKNPVSVPSENSSVQISEEIDIDAIVDQIDEANIFSDFDDKELVKKFLVAAEFGKKIKPFVPQNEKETYLFCFICKLILDSGIGNTTVLEADFISLVDTTVKILQSRKAGEERVKTEFEQCVSKGEILKMQSATWDDFALGWKNKSEKKEMESNDWQKVIFMFSKFYGEGYQSFCLTGPNDIKCSVGVAFEQETNSLFVRFGVDSQHEIKQKVFHEFFVDFVTSFASSNVKISFDYVSPESIDGSKVFPFFRDTLLEVQRGSTFANHDLVETEHGFCLLPHVGNC